MLHPKKHISSGEQLLKHLEDYFAWLDANPLLGGGQTNTATGGVDQVLLQRSGSATGFALYLGRSAAKFSDLRLKHADAFMLCIDLLRKRLLEKAVDKTFAEQVAAKPLLDLQVLDRPN